MHDHQTFTATDLSPRSWGKPKMNRDAFDSRLERFLQANDIDPEEWAVRAGLWPVTFRALRRGRDAHLSTVRAVIRAASDILGRAVAASDVFDLGEGAPTGKISIVPRSVSEYRRLAAKNYRTNLDRILRRESIRPNDFAEHVGIARQSLLRFRKGDGEPGVAVTAQMVRTLRAMTGKPYQAKHMWDVGEGHTL